MSNGRSVDSTCNTSLSPNRTLLDGWGGARAVPRERAQKDRNRAMHITLGEVSSNLKPAAVEVLRVLVDGCFPDKVRRAGANLILRIDYLSVGTIAKRAHWCKIDERDAARLADEGTLTDEDRRSLLAAKRRVDRALGQLVTSGIITRTRRAGGRSITLIELRAPFDIEEPGSTPPPGDSTDKPAARNDENVAPEGPARNDRNVAPVATQTSSPERHERRRRYDENVAPSPLSSPLSTPKTGAQQTNTDAARGGGGDAGRAVSDMTEQGIDEDERRRQEAAAFVARVDAARADADDEDNRKPDTDADRIAARRRMLAEEGIRGKMLDELSRRRLSLHTIASVISEVDAQSGLDNPAGFLVCELMGTPDDEADDTPARRYWPKPATIAAAAQQVDEGRDPAEVYDVVMSHMTPQNRIDWIRYVAEEVLVMPNAKDKSSEVLGVDEDVRRETSWCVIDSWKKQRAKGATR